MAARVMSVGRLAEAPDERLVALARAGDEQAFAAIVERYRAPLLQYCGRFLSGASAEDALQQTFINAYAALSRADARPPVALRPWLYRVAHNAALNVARDPHAGLAELPDGLDGDGRPDEVFAARERFRRVVSAVSALPPKQRQVIVRNAFEGDSHERIAADLGMSAGSIRQLAHRARRTLREAAAALVPAPLLRFLRFGADAVEAAPAAGGGAVLAKVALAVAVAGVAGGGAVEVTTRAAGPAEAAPHVRPAAVRTPVPTPPAPGSGAGSAPHGASPRGWPGSSRDGSPDSSEDGSSGTSGSSGRGPSGSSGGDSSGSSEGGSSGSPGGGSSGTSGGESSGSSSGDGSSGSGTSGSSGDGASGSSDVGSSGSSDGGTSATSDGGTSGSSGSSGRDSSGTSEPSGSSGSSVPGPSSSSGSGSSTQIDGGSSGSGEPVVTASGGGEDPEPR